MIIIDIEFIDDFFCDDKGILTRGFIIFKNHGEEWEILNQPMYVFSNWIDHIGQLLMYSEEVELNFYLGDFSLLLSVKQDDIFLTDKHYNMTNNLYSTFLWKDNRFNFVKNFIQVADKLSRAFYKNGLKEESINFNKKINYLRALYIKKF